jgi:hypothetical protein
MAFRHTQLGRFGDYGVSLKTHPHDDPDQQMAHLYASNGSLIARDIVGNILSRKGMWDQGAHPWTAWRTQFDNLRSNSPYSSYIHPRQARCTAISPRCPRYPHPHNCWHELVPPQEHYNLQGFAQQILPTLNNNLIMRPNGSLGLPPDLWPIWNFVVTSEGEILLSQEDFGIIKHPSISGGRQVWSAGQVGIEILQRNGQRTPLIRQVDLQSGHFVLPHVLPRTPHAQALINFTRDVFQRYEAFFVQPVPCLHPSFTCVWS